MGLFRPYTRDESAQRSAADVDLVSRPSSEQALHPAAPAARAGGKRRGATAAPLPAEPAPVVEESSEPAMVTAAAGRTVVTRTPARKDRPTPSRHAAQSARMERLHPTLTPQERKAAEREAARQRRMGLTDAVESRPERVLLRNFIDSSWHLSEFLMPLMILLMALVFGAQYVPAAIPWLSVLMWAVLLAVFADVALTWFRFKKVLRERLPKASPRGLLLYATNRLIQIRRFRVPPPVIKRGEQY